MLRSKIKMVLNFKYCLKISVGKIVRSLVFYFSCNRFYIKKFVLYIILEF